MVLNYILVGCPCCLRMCANKCMVTFYFVSIIYWNDTSWMALRSCYTRRLATTIFNAIQHFNIVATLFRMVTTLFQHFNAVLRQLLSLCNVIFKSWRQTLEVRNYPPKPKIKYSEKTSGKISYKTVINILRTSKEKALTVSNISSIGV